MKLEQNKGKNNEEIWRENKLLESTFQPFTSYNPQNIFAVVLFILA